MGAINCMYCDPEADSIPQHRLAPAPANLRRVPSSTSTSNASPFVPPRSKNHEAGGHPSTQVI